MLVDLPPILRDAIEQRAFTTSRRELEKTTQELSDRYRSAPGTGGPVARTAADALAYAVYRLPATYAATVAALSAVAEQRPTWTPRTMLDLGAGLGSGLWAATAIWPSIEQIAAVDALAPMISLGRELTKAGTEPALGSVNWVQSDLARLRLDQRYDLVLIAYVLGELDPLRIAEVVDKAWAATDGVLVIVEPGTPVGYARVLAAQSRLTAEGGHLLAPCPHNPPCVTPEGDWLHFSVRLSRSRIHRAAKAASLGYEDEKFSYIAASRTPVEHMYSRILRHPQIRGGHIYLQLCTPRGPKSVVVSKRDGELFTRARKADWGDTFELPDGDLV